VTTGHVRAAVLGAHCKNVQVQSYSIVDGSSRKGRISFHHLSNIQLEFGDYSSYPSRDARLFTDAKIDDIILMAVVHYINRMELRRLFWVVFGKHDAIAVVNEKK